MPGWELTPNSFGNPLATPLDVIHYDDTFSRIDSASLGGTERGNRVWSTSLVGTSPVVEIKSGRMLFSGVTTRATAHIETGAAKFIVEAVLGFWTGDIGNAPLLIVRLVNNDNYIALTINTQGRVALVKRAGGAGSTLAQMLVGPTVSAGDALAVKAVDSTYTVYVNGVELFSFVEEQFVTGTRQGLGLSGSTAGSPKTVGFDSTKCWTPGELVAA